MTIRKLVMLGGALLIAGLLGLLAASQIALYRLKVNGPVYADIVLSKDLIADILPPPKYIIEPFLEATLALNDPASVEARAKRLDELRTEYDIRQNHWVKQGFDDALKRGLTERSHAPAKRFWTTLGWNFLPALRRGDMAAAQAAYRDLAQAYGEHRAEIDQLVIAANAAVERTEQAARGHDRATMIIVWTASLFMLALLLAAIAALIRSVVAPLNAMTGAMAGMARGNLSTDVPFLERKDEIGAMAHALVVFKDALVAKKFADDQAAAEARSRAYRELREMEDWISRDKPSYEEVARKALELRRRHMITDASQPAPAPAPARG